MANVFTRVPNYASVRSQQKPGQLTEEQIKQFFDEGFLVVNNVAMREDLQPIKDDIDDQVDALADWLYKAGKIKDPMKNLGHSKRLTSIEKQYPGSTVLLHKANHTTQAFRVLWTSEVFLNMMEQLVGPNIAGHPVWNLRPKTPQTANHDVPWHQDSGYLSEEADGVLMVTAWIPLLDTNANNGCLQFLRGGHRRGVVGPHQGLWGDTWYIHMSGDDAKEALGVDPEADIVTCEVPEGSCVLFNNMIPHRSLPNQSDDIRWTMDLRWQNAELPTGFPKPSVLFRQNGENVKPDWEPFDACDRHKLVEPSSLPKRKFFKFWDEERDEFDSSVNPEIWMKRWPLTHENRHSKAWKRHELI